LIKKSASHVYVFMATKNELRWRRWFSTFVP